MTRPSFLRPVPAVVLLLLLVACSGPTTTPEPAPNTPAATAPESASPESVTPSPTDSATPTPTPEPRKKSQLRKALLAEDDLPSGFSKRSSVSASESGITVTGTGTSCPQLADLVQAEKVTGSLVTAGATFSRDGGAGIDESLDALPSKAEAAAVVEQFTTAASSCPKLRLKLRGAGSSDLKVEVVQAPTLGDASVTIRFTTQGGDIDGFRLTQVVASSEDILLGLLFSDVKDDQVGGIAEDAMSKVTKRLT